MENTEGRVLKAREVKLQGQYYLDLAQPSQNAAEGKKAPSGTPQVRMVENNADYAVVEITCRCGTKTQVRCDYNNTNIK